MSIILRSIKGSELTFAEVDGNFQSLYYSSSFQGSILNLYFFDGTSHSLNLSSLQSDSASYAATASYVLNAQSASYVLNAISSSYVATASNANNTSIQPLFGPSPLAYLTFVYNTSSYQQLYVDQSTLTYNPDIDTLNTTASVAISALTASYVENALTASYVENAQTASYVEIAQTASYATSLINGINITASNILVTGTASIVFSQIITSSTAFTSGSNLIGAGGGDIQTLWGTIDLKSGPLLISGSTNASGSITAQSFVGPLTGTASWANNAITASYILNAVSSSQALTSSNSDRILIQDIPSSPLNTWYLTFTNTNSGYQNIYTDSSTLTYSPTTDTITATASYAINALNAINASSSISASLAQTASFVQNAQTASFVQNAQSASYVLNAVTASFVQNAQSASYVLNAVTASFALNSPAAIFSSSSLSSSWASSSISASYATNALSASNANTASYILNAVSSSYATFAQNAFLATTASYTLYASLADAALYAQEALFATSSLSSSFASSSISASYASSSTSASYASSSTSASYATNALSASYALTTSYVENALTASYVLNAVSSSYSTFAENASFATQASNASTADFSTLAFQAETSSFSLNAQNSTTASYILNAVSSSYSQTASYAETAVTASFALSVIGGTFPFTGSAIISGSLTNIGNTILSGSTVVQSSSLTVSTGSLIVSLPFDGVDTTTNAVTINRGSNLRPALSVTGSTNFDGIVTIETGTLIAKDSFIASGSSTFTNGGVTVGSGITITGSTLITGSTTIVGNTTITGSLRVSGSITGSLNGTSSWATNAVSSSYILGAISNNTSSYVLTATGGGSINGEQNLTFDGTTLVNTSNGGTIKIKDTINNTNPTSGITSFVRYTALPQSINDYYGETISGIAATSISRGRIVYLTSSPHTWDYADFSTPSSLSGLIGVCLNSPGALGEPMTILLKGFVVTSFITSPSFVSGQALWLDGNGTLRDTNPGGSSRILGHYYEDLGSGYYNIRFNPDNYWA